MVAVRLVPVGSVKCGSLAWRAARSFTTVIVKATFGFDAEGRAELRPDGDDIVVRDEHIDNNPTRALREASDLAPYLAVGEVLFRGHAHPRGPAPTPCRIVVARGARPLIDKRFVVMSPRGEPVSLTAENAIGGPGFPDNPVGRAEPLVINPLDPRAPALVGPIPRVWRARASLLRPDDKPGLKKRQLEIGEGFQWAFFHAAPIDQRARTTFVGDESIHLEGLARDRPHVELRLPQARAEARWVRSDAPAVPIELRADTIRVDGDAGRVTLTWRGFFEVAEGEHRMVVAAGVSIHGAPIDWPEIAPETDEVGAPSPEQPAAVISLGETGILHLDGLNAPTLPFGTKSADEGSPSRPKANIPGAPFAPPSTPGSSSMESTIATDSAAISAPATPFPTRPVSSRPAVPASAPAPLVTSANVAPARPAQAHTAAIQIPTAPPAPVAHVAPPLPLPAAPVPAPSQPSFAPAPAPYAVPVPPAVPLPPSGPVVLPRTLGSVLLLAIAERFAPR